MNLLYIVDMFPSVSQIFISREIKVLEELGENVTILSLQKPSADHCLHRVNQTLKAKIYYSEDLSVNKINKGLQHLLSLASSPSRYFSSFQASRHPAGLPPRTFLFRQLPLFRELIKKEQIDHIHCHFGWEGMLAGWMLNKLSGVPFSVTLHGSDILVSPYESLGDVLKSSAMIVCVSRQIQDIVINRYGVSADKTVVIRCGIDPQQFQQKAAFEGDLNILTVARLHPVKGLGDLVEACRLLKEQGVVFHCTIAGEGDERQKLEELIDQYGLAASVDLPGSVANHELPGILTRHNIFVLPSHSEGVPVSLMEAMAVGLPVVATDVGGVAELVRKGENGVLVEPGNPLALADAIVQVQAMPVNEKQRLAQRNRARVAELFNCHTEGRRLRDVFGSLIEENS